MKLIKVLASCGPTIIGKLDNGLGICFDMEKKGGLVGTSPEMFFRFVPYAEIWKGGDISEIQEAIEQSDSISISNSAREYLNDPEIKKEKRKNEELYEELTRAEEEFKRTHPGDVDPKVLKAWLRKQERWEEWIKMSNS